MKRTKAQRRVQKHHERTIRAVRKLLLKLHEEAKRMRPYTGYPITEFFQSLAEKQER